MAQRGAVRAVHGAAAFLSLTSSSSSPRQHTRRGARTSPPVSSPPPLSARPHAHPHARPPARPPSACLSVCLSSYGRSVCLSVCLSVGLAAPRRLTRSQRRTTKGSRGVCDAGRTGGRPRCLRCGRSRSGASVTLVPIALKQTRGIFPPRPPAGPESSAAPRPALPRSAPARPLAARSGDGGGGGGPRRP